MANPTESDLLKLEIERLRLERDDLQIRNIGLRQRIKDLETRIRLGCYGNGLEVCAGNGKSFDT